MEGSTVPEVRDTVVRRIEFLDDLKGEPKDKRTMVSEQSCSRATVDRAIRELEAMDLVTYRDGRYHLTRLGRIVGAEYRRFEDYLSLVIRLKPFIRWLPLDEFDHELRCLTDAEVVVPDSTDPYAAANRHADVMATTDTFHGLLPAVGLNQIEAARESVVAGEREHHVVFERAVAEKMQSEPHYAEIFDELSASDRVEIAVYDGKLPYFLGVYDEIVHVGVEDEQGIPRALVETDDERTQEWARRKYEEYREQSRKLDC